MRCGAAVDYVELLWHSPMLGRERGPGATDPGVLIPLVGSEHLKSTRALASRPFVGRDARTNQKRHSSKTFPEAAAHAGGGEGLRLRPFRILDPV
jgi:hypothetical protein